MRFVVVILFYRLLYTILNIEIVSYRAFSKYKFIRGSDLKGVRSIQQSRNINEEQCTVYRYSNSS